MQAAGMVLELLLRPKDLRSSIWVRDSMAGEHFLIDAVGGGQPDQKSEQRDNNARTEAGTDRNFSRSSESVG